MTEDDGLEGRLQQVRGRVADAARAAGRDPGEVVTIVVTKFQPLALIERLAALGVTDFGESRHPEARDKAAALPDATWHFVGQLQTNKARQVARYADVIHSVDRAVLVDALAPVPTSAFLEIDLTGGATGRGGAAPDDAEGLAQRILEAGLPLLGVMAVAPQGEEPARAFARLAAVGERVRRVAPGATAMSAGMSGDFEAAIAAGATHLRIGVAITGPRPPVR
ncbi:alanine racemase [Amnibacterium sp. CER49]|uniref:YggS family pyridoxal phosphate enzyme n=1 Tax=Amnibacterium sp. CER49 TaxID=3039161 RepID=UPI002446D1EF|nr:alanine racemase [Amnibacterium sp. CER49]MDH2444700.1 alanine racemase [Amnibacterium sp. CER49]